MKIAEIQTDRKDDEGGWADEWLVIYQRDGFVSFVHEYEKDGERRSWQDSGSSFTFEHLGRVIDALVCIKSAVQSGTGEEG